MYIHGYVCVCMYGYVCMYMYGYVWICMYVYVWICMDMYVCICMYVCMYVGNTHSLDLLLKKALFYAAQPNVLFSFSHVLSIPYLLYMYMYVIYKPGPSFRYIYSLG